VISSLSTLYLALALVAGAQPSPAPASPRPALVRLLIQTDKGDFEAELDAGRAPITTANFLRYVDGGRYDGGFLHRALKRANQQGNPHPLELIQGSVAPRHNGRDFAAIRLERTRDTGLRHADGALSMAREAPDSATSHFFVCVGAQPALDFGGQRNPDGQGFAAFGRVTSGMDVVRQIQAGDTQGERLAPPARILRILRKP
jgi:peptidyl-prolyl cis-trans isomerase A (cyclophilin A)